jgi:predicted Zn-dependent protease
MKFERHYKNASSQAAAAAGRRAGVRQDPANQPLLSSRLTPKLNLQTRLSVGQPGDRHEQEADRVGMQILAKSDFDPRAMPSFFERMGRSGQAYATQLPEFLRTHPVTTSRIADAQGRAEGFPYRQRADSLGYQLARSALRVRAAHSAQDAAAGFQGSLRDGRNRRRGTESSRPSAQKLPAVQILCLLHRSFLLSV